LSWGGVTRQILLWGESAMKSTVFQIAYDEKLGSIRTALLTRRGYSVRTVFGNDAAKTVLSSPEHCDLFMVGDRAPEECRTEMVAWLKARYRGVPIVALNGAEEREVAGADYNVALNGPEAWYPVISTALT
jgi:DNA-binding NtrC family response regulator